MEYDAFALVSDLSLKVANLKKTSTSKKNTSFLNPPPTRINQCAPYLGVIKVIHFQVMIYNVLPLKIKQKPCISILSQKMKAISKFIYFLHNPVLKNRLIFFLSFLQYLRKYSSQ